MEDSSVALLEVPHDTMISMSESGLDEKSCWDERSSLPRLLNYIN